MTPRELLQHHDAGTLWAGACDLDVPAACQQVLAVRRLRIGRGERPRGFKVGTNRTICGDQVVDRGVGANVLDGPLHALRHFLQELRACPGAPDLQAGDVVTTGTWTDAWPVAPGETWAGEFDVPLFRLEIRFR